MTAPNWNPNSPGKRGIEHLDVGFGHSVIDAPADVGALHFEALATGPVSSIEMHAGTGAQAPPVAGTTRYNGLPRPMLVEVVPEGSEATGAITYSDFNVSQITGGPGMFNQNLTTPVVTGALDSFDTADFVVASTVGAVFEAQFLTNAFPLDRHVLAVEVHCHINLSTGVRRIDPGVAVADSPFATTLPMFSPNYVLAVLRMGEAIVEGTDTEWHHWTPQMIRDFAGGGTREIRISCAAGPGYWRMNRMYLRVYHQPERRVAVGVGSPTTPLTWVPFDMQTPNATGAPTLTNGNEYTMLCRRITDYSIDAVAGSTSLPWRFLRGRSPDGTWRRHAQPFNPFVGMSAAGAQVEGIPCVRMKNGSTVVAHSMPYELSRGALVYGTTIASQFITMAGGGTVYGQAYVVAGWNPATGRPVGPLRAEVYRVADGVRVFNPVEVTAADVNLLPVSAPVSNTDDLNVRYKTVVFRFEESETLSAGQYEVRVSSPDSTATRPWFVGAYMGDEHTTDQTFGSSTDYAEGVFLSGGEERELTSPGDLTSDLQVQLVEVPAAVTGVGASVGSVTAHRVEVCDPNSGCEGCADDTLPYAQVTWSPAPSGTPDVVAYNIDRMDDLSPDWERVATVWGRTEAAWNDHEVSIGITSQYRVRVVRDDDVVGDWSDPASILVPPGNVALCFSSNAATGMGCVYPEVWEGAEVERPWQFLEAGDVQLRRIYGRNRQVAFRPMERRGESFERTLLLNALCSITLPSMRTFHPLRDLSWAPIPYVCVRDGEGNRWYASLTVPDGVNRRSGGVDLWLADIGITEVSDSPVVHDTSIPQVTEVPGL